MCAKIITPEGKEVESTGNLDELSQHLYEDYDMLRAGIIDVNDAMARATLGKTQVSIRMIQIVEKKLALQGRRNAKEIAP